MRSPAKVSTQPVDVCVQCVQPTGCGFVTSGCVCLCSRLFASGKSKLGRSCGNAKATSCSWERETVITVLFCEGSPAFGAIKPITGSVSAEKAKVESV